MWRDWNPLREMQALRSEIDHVFEGFQPGDWSRRLRSVFLPGRSARGYPLVNIYEDSEAIHVEALAPGLDTDSLEVSVKGNTLTLAGEKTPLPAVDDEAYHRSERATGRVARTLQLDSEVDQDNIDARYENGVLMVTLPKSERAKPKKIAVSVE